MYVLKRSSTQQMILYLQFPKAPMWSVAEVLHKNVVTNAPYIYVYIYVCLSPQDLQMRSFPVCKVIY